MSGIHICKNYQAMCGCLAGLLAGKWRYERVEGAGHWIPRDAPDRLNALLLDFLGAPAPLGAKL